MVVPIVALFLAVGSASAAGSALVGAETPETQIYGGEEVDTCGWPSVAYVEVPGGGGCTGTLIHPRIVLTAAHCVVDGVAAPIRFGEQSNNGANELSNTLTCRQGPDWTGAIQSGDDYAYCLLDAPVTTVPIVPVASGCEQTAIAPGARIMHVGFGLDENNGLGRKKMLDTQITSINGGELISGSMGRVFCSGDSGGPTLVYLDPDQGGDGTWRVAAIHSWSAVDNSTNPATCVGPAGSVLASRAIEWIEQDSGIDITPCTDDDEWNPTAHCGGLVAEPWLASGSYGTDGCGLEGEVVEFAAVCGPPLDANADDVSPVVDILTPTELEELPPDDGTAMVSVEVEATDEGWGVESVELTIRSISAGQEQVDTRNEWQPWTWDASLPTGTYEVEAVATDHAGNVSEPVTVCFGVGQAPDCSDEGLDDESGTGVADGGSTGALPGGTAGEPNEPGDSGGAALTAGADGGEVVEGCSCRTRAGGPGGSLAMLALLLVGRRRRREA